MALATLSIDLVAQLAKFQQGLDKAGRLAEKQADQIARSFAGMQAAAVGVGAALAASLSAAGITAFVRATVDGLDRLNDLSEATGASIENLSALEDIAARTGTSMDTVADAVVKLNKSLGDAKSGSDAANALKALGLNAETLKRLDPAEALRQVAVALAGFANDGNKARIVQELFGKSIQQVAPLLNDLAAAGKLNATVTTEQAQAAEKFNQQLAALSKNSVDAARDISGPLITSLNKFFQELANARQAYGSVTAGVLDNFRLSTGSITGDLAKAAREIEVIQATIANADGGKTKPLFADQRKALLDEKRLLEQRRTFLKLQQQMDLPQADYSNEGRVATAARRLPNLPGTGGTKGAKDRGSLDPVGLSPAALDALKAIEQTDSAKIRQLNAALDELFVIRASGAGGGADVDEAIDKLRDDLEKLNPAAQLAAEAKKRLDELLKQTPTGVLGEVLIDIGLINKAFEAGQVSVEQWAEAARVATGKLPDAVKEPLAEISEFAQQAARNIQDALGTSIAKTLRGDFDSIGELWKNLLIDMAAQAIAADVGNAVFGNLSKGGSNAGLLSTLFGFAKGGAFAGDGRVMAFANGGVLTRATPFGMSGGRLGIAGEAGPEAVLPLKRGADGRLGVANTGGGGGITINVEAGVSRGEVTAAIQLAMQSVQSDIYSTLRAKRVM